ncbi:MAG: DUF192 domain-containing protein [Nanoarchaeota archaeon]
MKIYFLFVFFVLIFISGCSSEIKEICFENNCFLVETADTMAERENGLMNRDFLNENQGMLFIFEEKGIYPFWMKDTLIPLDIIWINSENKAVFIKENAQPCNLFEKKLYQKECEVFQNEEKAKYVLEINAGKVKELGIKIEDKAEFK